MRSGGYQIPRWNDREIVSSRQVYSQAASFHHCRRIQTINACQPKPKQSIMPSAIMVLQCTSCILVKALWSMFYTLRKPTTERLWYSRPRSSCRLRCGTASSQPSSWFTKQHEVVLALHFGTWQKVCPGHVKVYTATPWSRKHPTDLCLIVHAEWWICIHIAGVGAQVIASSWTNCHCQSRDACVSQSETQCFKLIFSYVEGKSVNLKAIMLPSSWNLSMQKPLFWICF